MSQTPRSTVGTVKSWNSRYSDDDDSYVLHNQPIEEVEQARLRPSTTTTTTEEFPWLKPEFQLIRNAGKTQSPPRRGNDGYAFNRNQSQRSTRSRRTIPRESIIDLHLIVSDLDYYAGAVHDYQAAEEALSDEERWDEEEMQGGWPLPPPPPPPGEDGDAFGQIQIIRTVSKKPGSRIGRGGTTIQRGASKRSIREKDINFITWDGPDDPENPKNWTKKKKWMATITVSLFTFISPVASTMVAPALTKVAADLNITGSKLLTQLAMSVFVLAFAIGPLLLGPLSELFGRRVILQTSNLFFFAFNMAAGFATTSSQMIAFRFLSGLGGSAPLAIGGAVLADLWSPMERGRAMALYSLMPLLGPAIGPIAGGFIAQYSSTWRWVFWSTSIAAILIQILGYFFLDETSGAQILQRKKHHLMKITGNNNNQTPPFLHTEFDDAAAAAAAAANRKVTLAGHVGTAFQRPFILLFTQPIVQLLALYIGYVYGVLYLVLSSFPRVWAEVYGQDPGRAGLNYISLGLGFFIGTQIAAKFSDKIYKNLKAKQQQNREGGGGGGGGEPGPGGPGQVGRSEFRVPLMFPGAVMVPVGLFIYGWSAEYKTHWIVPNVGTMIFAAGNQLVFQNCQTYLVDAYTRYAASAIAATAVLRSLGGFAFPLFAPFMYDALGYGWGNSVLGFVGIAVGFPAPFVLWCWGKALRERSTFAAG